MRRRPLPVVLCLALALGGCATAQQQERDARLVNIRTQLGAGFLKRGQLAIAQDELNRALALNPDDSEANNVMALIQARLRRYDRANRYFERSLRDDPGNSGAQNNYGIFLCQRGRVPEAIAHFQKAIADPLYPTPQWANVNAGSCLLQHHEPRQARAFFKDALALQPNLGVALYQLARIDLASGHPHRARAYIQRYFAVAGNSPESLLLAVRIEQALGNIDKQATYALRLTSQYPHSAQAQEIERLGANGEL